MTYINTWRSNLKTHLAEFAPLAKEDRSINLIYGITAAAVMWGVRDAPFNDEQKTALKEAVGDEKHLPHLLRAIGGWDAMTPLEAARSLSKRQRDSDELREALTALMGTFIEELFAQNMVQGQHIDISGTISGGNIVIGGYQIVAGDMVIQHITQQKIRACPTAPKPPAHFAGRRDELNRLKDVLTQGQSVAITGIQGVGGIGKTALSLQLASEMSEFSAVLWASLGPNPNTGNQLIEWARHADPDFDPGQDDLDVLVSRVQALLTNLIQDECPGRVLVILDDIWEGDSMRAARTLQKAAPVNSVSLITTRSQRVVAQLRSTRLELQPMTPQDALQMLRNLLSDYPDIPDDTLLELAEVVGYHPLAMELAAGQVTLLERPIQEITEQIERYRGGIPAGSPFRDIGLELGEDREDNLEVVLAFSYDSLTETEQAQFRALGVLAYNAPFDRDICCAIWDVDDPKTSLDDLRHRALLNIAEEEGWYQQHVLLRSYARALLATDEMKTRFACYGNYLNEHADQFDTVQMVDWDNQIGSYYPHMEYYADQLVAMFSQWWDAHGTEIGDGFPEYKLPGNVPALKWLSSPSANNTEFCVDDTLVYVFSQVDGIMLHSSFNYYIHLRHIDERGLDWLRLGYVSASRQADKKYQSSYLNEIGIWLLNHDHLYKALDYFESSPISDQELQDIENEASTLTNIGLVYAKTGEPYKALEYYEKALPKRRKAKDLAGEATTLNNIAMIWQHLGDISKAIACHNQALNLRDDEDGRAHSLHNLGYCWSVLGESEKALSLFEEAISLFKRTGNKGGRASSYLNMGLLYRKLGQARQSLNYYENALQLYKATGSRRGEATVLTNIGAVWSLLGNKHNALDYFQQALEVHRITVNRAMEATSLNNIGLVWKDLGEHKKAIQYYSKALDIARIIHDRSQEGTILNNIGGVHQANDDLASALQFFSEALEIRRSVGDKFGEAKTLGNIGLAHSKLGDHDRALRYLQRSLSLMKDLGDRSGEATSLGNLGTHYLRIGHLQQALDYFAQSLPIRKEVEDPEGEATSLNNIGRVYCERKELPEALRYYQQALSLAKSVGLRLIEAVALSNIGEVFYLMKDYKHALSSYQELLEVHRTIEHRTGEAATLHTLGVILHKLEDLDQALTHFNRALRIREQNNLSQGLGATLHYIGKILDEQSKKAAAVLTYERALQTYEDEGNLSEQANVLGEMAKLKRAMKDDEQALTLYHRKAVIHRSLQDHHKEATALFTLAGLYHDMGELTNAETHYNQTLNIRQKEQNIERQAASHSYLAIVTYQLRRGEKALQHIHAAIERRPNYILDKYWRAQIMLGLGEYQNAIEDLTTLRSQLSDPISLTGINFWQATAYKQCGKQDHASQAITDAKNCRDRISKIYYKLLFNALFALYNQDYSAGRALCQKVLLSDEYRKKPASFRFYVFQFPQLFPDQEEYAHLYMWFANRTRELYKPQQNIVNKKG